MSPSNSPYFGAPPPNNPLQQLAEDNPDEFVRYMNLKHELNYDVKSGKETKKHPTRSGVPGKSF